MLLTIKTWRAYYNLTQPQLAKKVGVSVQTIVAWESGRVKPTAKHLKAIAEALEVREENIEL